MDGATIAQLLVSAAVTGGVAAVATVAAIKVELRWIKRALGKLESRVGRVEGEVFQPKRS